MRQKGYFWIWYKMMGIIKALQCCQNLYQVVVCPCPGRHSYLRIESYFWSFDQGMNGITDVHIFVWRYNHIARHTKLCASVIPFIPSPNDQNQLSSLITNFLLIVCS